MALQYTQHKNVQSLFFQLNPFAADKQWFCHLSYADFFWALLRSVQHSALCGPFNFCAQLVPLAGNLCTAGYNKNY